jgi:hypothetical protein
MSVLSLHAAWVLVAAFVGSLVYELYRATAKAGTSPHDSIGAFLRQTLALYVAAIAVIAMLFSRVELASWVGFAFSVAVIGISVFYYNPAIMAQRRPGLVDWIEDLGFTGLLFVAAVLLLYDATGWTLQG